MAGTDHARTSQQFAQRASMSDALSKRGTSDMFHTLVHHQRSVFDETARPVEPTAPRQTVVEQARQLAHGRRFSILGTAIPDPPITDSQELPQHATSPSANQPKCVADRHARRGSFAGTQTLAERMTPSSPRKTINEGPHHLAHASSTPRKPINEGPHHLAHASSTPRKSINEGPHNIAHASSTPRKTINEGPHNIAHSSSTPRKSINEGPHNLAHSSSTPRKSMNKGPHNLAHPSVTRRQSVVEETRDGALKQGHDVPFVSPARQRNSLSGSLNTLMVSSQQSASSDARHRAPTPTLPIVGMDTRQSRTCGSEQIHEPHMHRQRRNSLFTDLALMRCPQKMLDPRSHSTRTAPGRRHSIVGTDDAYNGSKNNSGTDALIGLQGESLGASRRQSNLHLGCEDESGTDKNSIGEKFLRRKVGSDRFAAYCVGAASGNTWGQHDRDESLNANVAKLRRGGGVAGLGLMRGSLIKEYFDKGRPSGSPRGRSSTGMARSGATKAQCKERQCTTTNASTTEPLSSRPRGESGRNDAESTSAETMNSTVRRRSTKKRNRAMSESDTSIGTSVSQVHRRSSKKRTISEEEPLSDARDSEARRRGTLKNTMCDEGALTDAISSAVTRRPHTRQNAISHEKLSAHTRGTIVHHRKARKRAFSHAGLRSSVSEHRRATHQGAMSDNDASRANAVHPPVVTQRRMTHDPAPVSHPPPIQRRGSAIIQRSIALLEERRALRRAETLTLGSKPKDKAAHQREVLDVVRTSTQQTIEKMKRTNQTDVRDVAGIGQFIERELIGANWLPDATERLAHWRHKAEMQMESDVARKSLPVDDAPSSFDECSSSSSSSSSAHESLYFPGAPPDHVCDKQSTNTFFTNRLPSSSIRSTPGSRNFPSPMPESEFAADNDDSGDGAFNNEVTGVHSMPAQKYDRRHSVHHVTSASAADLGRTGRRASIDAAVLSGTGHRNSTQNISANPRGSGNSDRRNSLARLIALCGGNATLNGTMNAEKEEEFTESLVDWRVAPQSEKHVDRDMSNVNASVIVTQPRDSHGVKNAKQRASFSPNPLDARATTQGSPSPSLLNGWLSLNSRDKACARTKAPSPLLDTRLKVLHSQHFRTSVKRTPSPTLDSRLSVLSIHRASVRDGSRDEKRRSVLYEDAPEEEGNENELKNGGTEAASSDAAEEEAVERPHNSSDSQLMEARRPVAVPACSVCPELDDDFRRKFLCRIPRSITRQQCRGGDATKVTNKIAGHRTCFSARQPGGGFTFPSNPPCAELLVMPPAAPRKAALHTWLSNRQGSIAGEMTRVAPQHVLLRRYRTKAVPLSEVVPIPALA